MFISEFPIYLFNSTTPQNCKVEVDDEFYHITIDGKYLGLMERDYNSDFGFKSEDKNIIPLIEDLAYHLIESKNRTKFPERIIKIWGDTISRTEFINDSTLVVECHIETDLEEFGAVVRDVILDYVDFEEHLDIILTKEASEQIIEIGIN